MSGTTGINGIIYILLKAIEKVVQGHMSKKEMPRRGRIVKRIEFNDYGILRDFLVIIR